MAPAGRPVWIWPLAAFLFVFGLLTLREGGGVLLGDPAAVSAAGAYVPFVVWFNTMAGFAYLVAAFGLARRSWWTGWLALLIAGSTVAIFAAFLAHVALGGAYETRTLGAMVLRSVVWVGVAIVTHRRFGRD